jgi:hypothetical protein
LYFDRLISSLLPENEHGAMIRSLESGALQNRASPLIRETMPLSPAQKYHHLAKRKCGVNLTVIARPTKAKPASRAPAFSLA